MKKYINDLSVIESKIYVDPSSKPVSALLSVQYSTLNEDEKKKYIEEQIGFITPSWALSSKVERMSSYVPSTTNEQVLDKLLFLRNKLRYYLRKCSFFDLVLETDKDGDTYVKNVDQFLSEISSSVISVILIDIVSITG